MKFSDIGLKDAKLIELSPFQDERGLFARTFCEQEFEGAGIINSFAQMNLSENKYSGTLRGLHFQNAPHAEAKYIRCVKGAIYDVILDVRPDSPTYREWRGFELSETNGAGLYAPKGFAHGFITLRDDTTVVYMSSDPYAPGAEGGVRWNDPQFDIQWPIEPKTMSDKDRNWPDFPLA